jgi:protein-disulfide isomerase
MVMGDNKQNNDNPQKPAISDTKKYALLVVAGILLIGAYFIGQSIEINQIYDSKATASVNHSDIPKGEIINAENLKLFPSDQIMGDPSEKPVVTIIEYASLTCPHCADFHNNSLGKIKNDYINSKKIQYIFRDYPLDGAALKATLLAKCDLSKRQAFIDLLFKKQSEWTKAKTIEEIEKNLMLIGKIGGLSATQITECFNNTEATEEILAVQKESEALFKIQATPTILINNQKFTGGIKVNDLKNILDSLLSENSNPQKSNDNADSVDTE